jgi:LPXTG-site transpeptidase (sortase) family protein
MRWKPKHARPRYWLGMLRARPAAVAGVALVAVAGVSIWAVLSHRGGTGPVAGAAVTIQASDTQSPAALGNAGNIDGAGNVAAVSGRPVSIDIPAINVHTTLQQLGLDSAGMLAPPTDLTQAGWYTGSPVPGQNGPSVIAGHVDSFQGPAVFFELKLLKPGDAVTVNLSSGQHVVFSVMLVKEYPKDAFPTADVYGARPDPELRLITCGGAFAAGHYLDNIVVYADLRTTA